jgi:twitching motility protein PilT
MHNIDSLLKLMVEKNASDLHISSYVKPVMRIDGNLRPVADFEDSDPHFVRDCISHLMTKQKNKEVVRLVDIDFIYALAGVARFRCNLYEDIYGPAIAIRAIPFKTPTIEQLGFSKAISDICLLTSGLVLVVGPTGSGKSTTLAAMIEHINKIRSEHVITIEDPIEFVYSNNNSLIHQREVGKHTENFKIALRSAFRENPDIILLGEIRDLETMETAIEIAESGHLVLSTLHTNSAIATVNRLIDEFPEGRQPLVRSMLADSLKAVIAQVLCKRKDGGRVAAQEIMLMTSGISTNIREGRTHQIQFDMQVGRSNGMTVMNEVLLDYVKRGLIYPQEAYIKSPSKLEMYKMLDGSGYTIDRGKISVL